MLKRTLRLSIITMCILCTFFLVCTGVFAATRQNSNISTTVQFTPGILAKVYVSVGGGANQLIFDNTSENPTLNTTYFTLSENETPLSGTNNSQAIVFTIENHNIQTQNDDKGIMAQIYYADAHKGWYFADTEGDELPTTTYNAQSPETAIQTSSIVGKANANAAAASETTNTFHIISLFDNTTTKIIINLSDV